MVCNVVRWQKIKHDYYFHDSYFQKLCPINLILEMISEEYKTSSNRSYSYVFSENPMTSSSRDWQKTWDSPHTPRDVSSLDEDRAALFYQNSRANETTSQIYYVDDDDDDDDEAESEASTALNLSITNLGKWRNTTFKTTANGKTVFTKTKENLGKRCSDEVSHSGVINPHKSDCMNPKTSRFTKQWKDICAAGYMESYKGTKRGNSGNLVSTNVGETYHGNGRAWAKRIRFADDVSTDNVVGPDHRINNKRHSQEERILTVAPPLQINNAINSGEETYEGLVKSMKEEFFSVLEGVIESVAKTVVDEMTNCLAKKNIVRSEVVEVDDRNEAGVPVVCYTNSISPLCCDNYYPPSSKTSDVLCGNIQSRLKSVSEKSESSHGGNFLHSVTGFSSNAQPFSPNQLLERDKPVKNVNIYSLDRDTNNLFSGTFEEKKYVEKDPCSLVNCDTSFSSQSLVSLSLSDRPAPFVSLTRSSRKAEVASFTKRSPNITVVSRQKHTNNDTTATTFSHIFSSPHTSIGKCNKHSSFEECKNFSQSHSLPPPLKFGKLNFTTPESVAVHEVKPAKPMHLVSEDYNSCTMSTNVSTTTFKPSSMTSSTSQRQDLGANQFYFDDKTDVKMSKCLDKKQSLSQFGPIKKRPIIVEGQETSKAKLLRSNLLKMERLIKEMGHNNSVFVVNKFQEGLTPEHLQKAKWMFFYTRYPSVHTLKLFFRDVKFTRGTTSQINKWFTNFREFYYIQVERFVRQSIKNGVTLIRQVRVTRESDLIEIFDQHFNKSSEFELPDKFVEVTLRCFQEIFMSIQMRKDRHPSWKKSIYEVVRQLDQVIPEAFKAQNPLQNLKK